MSWYRGKKGRGTEVAAWTAGAFAEERASPHHSEETRQLLEAHERLLHVFALLHHEDEISVSSNGHFTQAGPGQRYVGCGSSQLQASVTRIGVAVAPDEPDDDRTERLLGEAVETQKALTDAHSPRVIHGVTTPITPAKADDETEKGNEEGEGLLVLQVGAGLLPPQGEMATTDGEGAESGEEMRDEPTAFERLRRKLGGS